MKAFFIVTGTNEVHKHFESFLALGGNDVCCHLYNHHKRHGLSTYGEALDSEIYEAAQAYDPDLIVYVGACGGNTPSPELFARLKDEIAPTVHFCSDAGDDPWWPFLRQYHEAGSFSLQVALDGTKTWPNARKNLSALTVIDTARFPSPPRPHAERPIRFGFAGNVGAARRKKGPISERRVLVDQMAEFGLQYRLRDNGADSYQACADFVASCAIVPNFARTGSQRHMHVKGRVIEAGLAGALLLEQRGSPTNEWFTPGIDYLEYGTVEEARKIVEHYARRSEKSQAFGERLRAKVMRQHSPAAFWSRIFERVRLAPAMGVAA